MSSLVLLIIDTKIVGLLRIGIVRVFTGTSASVMP